MVRCLIDLDLMGVYGSIDNVYGDARIETKIGMGNKLTNGRWIAK
jgi:hypothetical protein